MLPNVITTPRLRLRPFRLDDADDVVAYANDPEWSRYLPTPCPYTREQADIYIRHELDRNWLNEPIWAIEREGVVVGGINLGLSHTHRRGVLGYSIARALWGQGYMTEAVAAVIDAAFTALPELNKITSHANPLNRGSTRVMEKVGMMQEAYFRQHLFHEGDPEDQVHYGLLREEWAGR